MQGLRRFEWFPLGFVEDNFPYDRGIKPADDTLSRQAQERLVLGLEAWRFFLEPKLLDAERQLRCVRGSKPYLDIVEAHLDLPLLIKHDGPPILSQVSDQAWGAVRDYLSTKEFFLRPTSKYEFKIEYGGERLCGLHLNNPRLAHGESL